MFKSSQILPLEAMIKSNSTINFITKDWSVNTDPAGFLRT